MAESCVFKGGGTNTLSMEKPTEKKKVKIKKQLTGTPTLTRDNKLQNIISTVLTLQSLHIYQLSVLFENR